MPDVDKKVEFIESYIKHGNGDYTWNDNHGELIRCKDCKHRGYSMYCPVALIVDLLKDTRVFEYKVSDDWFCADGERKG